MNKTWLHNWVSQFDFEKYTSLFLGHQMNLNANILIINLV